MSEADNSEELERASAQKDLEVASSKEEQTVLEPQSRTSQQQIVATEYSYYGPLPPPQVLQAYGLVQPGLDTRLVDMLEQQTQHRQELERTVIVGDGRRAWSGIFCAFVLSLTSIGGGIYLVARDHDVAGTILSASSLASLAGVFIYGTNQRKDERQAKLEALLKQASSRQPPV